MHVRAVDRTLRRLAARPAARRLAAEHGVDLVDLSELSVPDSRSCREVEQLCRDVSSEALVNHCFRSYAWGLLISRRDHLTWDPERYYASAMLHDLGLTAAFDRGGCFESDSADAAREILAGLGWADADRECVADAIYLHMHDVSPSDSGEALLLAAGTAADVSGARALEVAEAARSLVLDLFPRRGFKREVLTLFEAQARAKPACVVAQYLGNGLGSRILAAPYDD